MKQTHHTQNPSPSTHPSSLIHPWSTHRRRVVGRGTPRQTGPMAAQGLEPTAVAMHGHVVTADFSADATMPTGLGRRPALPSLQDIPARSSNCSATSIQGRPSPVVILNIEEPPSCKDHMLHEIPSTPHHHLPNCTIIALHTQPSIRPSQPVAQSRLVMTQVVGYVCSNGPRAKPSVHGFQIQINDVGF